jgi:hypothetical protein
MGETPAGAPTQWVRACTRERVYRKCSSEQTPRLRAARGGAGMVVASVVYFTGAMEPDTGCRRGSTEGGEIVRIAALSSLSSILRSLAVTKRLVETSAVRLASSRPIQDASADPAGSAASALVRAQMEALAQNASNLERDATRLFAAEGMQPELTAPESAIRDVDRAAEVAALSRVQILEEAGMGALSHVQLSSERVLDLLVGGFLPSTAR